MLRRYSALFAVFVVSGLGMRAGLAGANNANVGDPAFAWQGGSRADLGQLADLDAPVQAPRAVDWPGRIDARMAALGRDLEAEPAPAAPVSARTRRTLERAIDQALATLGPQARAAVELRVLDSRAALVERGGDHELHPASTQKLVTALAAVELLGPDYRFETTVSREGDALVLRGQGDPDLHLAELHELATAVLDQPHALDGVRRIVVDDSAFSHQRLGPGFRSGGPGDSYIAPSGALAMDYATVEVTVRPGPKRVAAEVSVSVPDAALELVDRSRTGSGRLSITTEAGSEGRTRVTVEGAIPAGHAPITVRRRVHDPGLTVGASFAELLARLSPANTAAPLPVVRGRQGAESSVLAVHRSAPLSAVLSSALRFSNNFTAEQVLRTLAWRATDTPGSWEDGVAVLERFADTVASTPERAAEQRFVNGSGLNRDGRLSPAFLVDVLALTERAGSPAQTLLSSFAQAGQEGTLRGRLPAAGPRLLAKTGTYGSTSSLAGVVYDSSGGQPVGFAILVNGESIAASRAAQDAIVAALLQAN